MTILKAAIILFLLFNFPTFLPSYIDNHQKRIENLIKDAERIIIKSKTAIIKNVEKDNINSVITIIRYLYSYFDGLNIVIFQPYEKWILSILTKQYHLILKDIENFNFSSDFANRLDSENPENNFFRHLCRQTFNKKNKLIKQIKKSTLSISETEFITLLLNKLINWGTEASIDQKTINKQSNAFMEKYKKSKFRSFIKEYIYVPIEKKNLELDNGTNNLAKNEWNPEKKSKWNFGIDFGLGYGNFTSKLSEHFTSYIPISVGFTLLYNKFRFFTSLRACPGINVKEQFSYNGIWKNDLPLQLMNATFSFAYSFIRNKSFDLSYYTGFSLSSISPPDEISKEPGNDVSTGTLLGFVLGGNFEVSLGSSGERHISFWALRLSFEYHIINYPYEKQYFDGNFFFSSIGIVLYINPW